MLDTSATMTPFSACDGRPIVVIDSQETRPYRFDSRRLRVVRSKLSAGSYSLDGREDEVAFERCTLDEFVTAFTERLRPTDQMLTQLATREKRCLIIEGTLNDPRYRALRTEDGAAVLKFATEMAARASRHFQIQFHFCATRAVAQNLLQRFLLRASSN